MPKSVINSEELAKVIFNVRLIGNEKSIPENVDIKRIEHSIRR